MNYTIEPILKMVYDILNNKAFMEKYRMSEKDFTRSRKLGFAEICLLVLKGFTKGLAHGIGEFIKEFGKEFDSYSKSSFCEARRKIKPEAFQEICKLTVENYYSKVNYKTYCGYRVCAIDGMRINLPNTDELLENYGSQPYSQGTVQAQALVSCLYDVMNEVVLDTSLNPHNSNERTLAYKHFDYLDSCRTEKELIIMDRGYPSEEMLIKLEEHKFNYIIRTHRTASFKELRTSSGADVVLERQTKQGKILKFRRIEFMIGNGDTETLITNIFDDSFTVEDFCRLYTMRWKIEVNYNTMKNRLMLEKFSGVSEQCILQDFYANVFLVNLLAYVRTDTQSDVDTINNSKKLKHQYQLNISSTIEALRPNVIKLFVVQKHRKQRKLLNQIYSSLLNCLCPIRPDRSFPRQHRHPSIKFPQNRKLF